MICLAVDTSSKFLCVVLMQNDRVLRKYNRIKDRAHGQLLMPTIEHVLKKQKFALSELDCLAVNIGPGSFTGLRIGIAAVKGLSLALNIPIISICSLDLIASNSINKINEKKVICSIIDAKRKQVYGGVFKKTGDDLKRQGKYYLGSIDGLLENMSTEVLFSGDGVSLYKDQIINTLKIETCFSLEKLWHTDPAVFAKLCYQNYKKKKFKKAKDIVPLYLYSHTCTVRKKVKKQR